MGHLERDHNKGNDTKGSTKKIWPPVSINADLDQQLGELWLCALSNRAAGYTRDALGDSRKFANLVQTSTPDDFAAVYAAKQLHHILTIGIRAVNVMGTMGCGKSTVAEAIARNLGFNFKDADDFHSIAAKNKMQANEPLNDNDREPFLTGIREFFNESSSTQGTVSTCSALRDSYRAVLAGQSFEALQYTNPWEPKPNSAALNYGLLQVLVEKPFEIALNALDHATKNPDLYPGRPSFIKVTKENPQLLENQYHLLKAERPRAFQVIPIDTMKFYDPETGRFDSDSMISAVLKFIPHS